MKKYQIDAIHGNIEQITKMTYTEAEIIDRFIVIQCYLYNLLAERLDEVRANKTATGIQGFKFDTIDIHNMSIPIEDVIKAIQEATGELTHDECYDVAVNVCKKMVVQIGALLGMGGRRMTYEEANNLIDDITWSYGGKLITNEDIKECRKICHEALEKQIPKKPPNHDRNVCPNCNSKAKYGHPYESYCCHCGQAIDWGEDE